MTRIICASIFLLVLGFFATKAQAQAATEQTYPQFKNIPGPDGVASGNCEAYSAGKETIKGLIRCRLAFAQVGSIRWGKKLAEFRRFNSLSDAEIRASKECRVALEGSYDDWTDYLLQGPEATASLSQKSAREFLEVVRTFCENPNHENKSAALEYSDRFQKQGCTIEINTYTATFQYDQYEKVWASQDVNDSRNAAVTFKIWREGDTYTLQRLTISGQNKTRPIGPKTSVVEYSPNYKGQGTNCSGIFPIYFKKIA